MDEEEFAEDTISQEEMMDLQNYLRQQAPMPEEKIGIPHLLTKIFKSGDTRKSGNVQTEELEKMRIYLEGAEFFNQMGSGLIRDWLKTRSEILSSTSLSHKGKFLDIIVTSKRDISLGKDRAKKRPFFSRSGQQEGGQQ